MSYLPRMSKTYKEPPPIEPHPLELENTESSNFLKPASSLLNEKTYNPLMALKHYKYLPHKPPVLPGPSVAEEAAENELFRESIRCSSPSVKLEDVSSNSQIDLKVPTDIPSETSVLEDKSLENISYPSTQSSTKKSSKGSKRMSKKKQSKTSAEKKGESSNKTDNYAVSICLVEDDFFNPFLKAQKSTQKKSGWNETEEKKNFTRENFFSNYSFDKINNAQDNNVRDIPGKSIETSRRSTPCTIYGSTDKTCVIPSAIYALLRTLAFLLHELNNDEITNFLPVEGQRLMTHIQLLLNDLCSQKVTKDFGFNITYSDSKRMEKIFEDLKKYLKNVYDDKCEFLNNIENSKERHIQLHMKKLELQLLKDKLQQKEEIYNPDVELKENDLKHPEVAYQNKVLESEQLAAEKEFSKIELRKYQKSLAEMNWEIHNNFEQINDLRRISSAKSKIELLGRNLSSMKFPGDVGLP